MRIGVAEHFDDESKMKRQEKLCVVSIQVVI